ncbi:hypothetical protein BDR26DRAFT_936675 [Obelidium mucronatum]|nr:hypothetical protein BDR26DRAFT_936675 [Obelidium mucronatum]
MTSRNEAKNLMELYSKFLVDMVALIENPSTHWRARAMAVNLLEVVWRPQDVQPTILTRVLLEGVVSPHPTLRDVTISLLARVLRSLKARAKTAGTDRTKVWRREVIRTGGDVVDTDTYLKNSVVSGATNIHDSSIVGWYCWPTKVKFYTLVGSEFDVGGDTLESLPYYDKESRESLELLSLTINQASFWEKLSLYHSQESSKGAEAFNSDLFNLVRVLAGQFEDSFVGHLKHAVVELVKDPKDKSKQRAAAELLAGLVRGSKNWSIPKTEKLWGWVMPILETAFQTASTETVRFWIDFLNAVLVNRDPRRVLPIIRFVFNWKLDPVAQSFFTEAKKLTLIKIVVSCFKWRLLPLYPPLLAELVSQIRHPYQQVRDVLGVVIDMIMQLLWHPSANSVEEIIQWSIFSGGSLHPDIYSANSFNGVVPVVLHESVKLVVENLFIDMKKWRAIERVNKIGPSDYGNASKTVIAWILGSMAWNATTAKFTCFHLQIPELFKMIDYGDLELQKMAAGIATMYSNLPFPLHFLPQVLDRILALLADPDLKWQVKLKLIPCLQILFFKNLLFLTSEMKVVILDTVSTLLLHPQVEIRNLAGVTLSGLVLCSERASISALKTKFEGSLKASKSAKKKTTLPPNPSTSPTTGSLHPLALQRHAAVIGLSSLILAFPYDVPSWMPAVLITLSSCISDQAPIGETVAKTFADFRRTHQDNWKEEGSKAFTEDQLSILSDLLISSSYYA